MTGHFFEQVSNEQGYPTYLDGYTVETNRGDTWNLVSSIFGPLVQGVDYVMHFFNAVSGEEIEPTSDAVQQAGSDGNIIRVVFQGIGRFAGSIQRMFKLDNSANEDVFARLYLGQGVYRAYGTVFTDGAAPDGKGKTEVWVDQDGQIVDADVLVVSKGLYGENLSRGVDYSDVYIIDEQGLPISYVVEGPQVVEVVGMGDFAGLTKRIDVIAHDASSLTDISKANFVLRDGFSSLGDNSYGVLRGRAMNATVWVAAENGQELVEGTDFTLTRAIEGDQLVLTATAVPGSGFTGSKTLSVEIAPLDISRYASVNFDGWESNFSYQSGTPVISNITSAAVTMKASPMQISVYDYGYARDTRTRLTRGVDYQISIADVDGNAVDTITRVGRYVVTLTGMGEWTGSASFDLRVEAYAGNYTDGRNIAEDSSYSLVADYDAEGLAVVASANSRPEFRLVVGGVILNEGTDYTLSYSMPDPLGYAHVTAVGTGTEDDGYYGQLMVPYKVEQKANLAEMVLMFQVEKNGVIGWTNANGNRRITVDLVDGVAQPVVCVGASQGGRTTAARYDFSCIPNRVDPSAYDVEFGNNTEPGQIAWVKVTPKAGSGYVGTLSANFMVAESAEPEGPKDIAQATLSVADQTYTGSALTPTVKVMYKGKVVDPSNYTVQYAKNTQIGTATVTVTGTGDFTGVATTTFRIDPANINDAVVSELAHFTYTGEEITPELRVSMNGKLLKLGVDYTLDYEDNIDAGTGSVFINGKGNYTDTTVAEFVIEPADISEALFDEIYEIYTGSPVEPDPIVMYNWVILERDVDYTLSYSNNVEVGAATVTATGMGNFTGSISTEFSIAPRSLDYAYIELIDDQVYTGEEIQPEPIVTVGDKTLVADEDYIFFYFNHIDAGVATVVIQGMGNYEGEMYLDFNILPASIEDVTIPDIAPVEYTGSAITPKITLSFGDIELVQGIDFTTSFTNNVNAGTATVGIEGMNNFEGTVYKSFTITPKSLADASIAPIEAIYAGKPVTPEPAITLDGKTLAKDVDYTLSYSNNDNIGVATLTVTGKGNYAGTVSCEFTIAPKTLSGATVAPIPAQTYTGDAITPVVAVTLEGKQLVKDVDYTLSYSNNVNAGTATMTVLGKGEYSGSVSAEFKINPAKLASSNVVVPESLEYTGTALTPNPTVTVNGNALVKDVDYTVAYSNNVKVGTATVTVTGKGNYTGIGSKTFAIVGKSIASAKVAVGSEFEFTGAAITPEPVVTLGGKTLVKGTDYTVSYADNVKVGTATVTVTGKGNYAGTVSMQFSITPQTLASAEMAPVYDTAYTGQAITPEPAITLGGKALIKDVDYALSYSNNVKGGLATVTATGIGDYEGVISRTFLIWYEATYELNGGENDGDNRTQFIDPHQLADPYRAGYEFAGWFTDPEFAEDSQVTKLADDNFTVYAKWAPVEYTITYNLNGGMNGKNPDTYTVEDAVKIASATRSGFSFRGWFYDEACTVMVPKTDKNTYQIEQGTYGDITLYAQWSVSITKNMTATTFNTNGTSTSDVKTDVRDCLGGFCEMVRPSTGIDPTRFPVVGNLTAFMVGTNTGYSLKAFNVTYTDKDGVQQKLTYNNKDKDKFNGLSRVGNYSAAGTVYEFTVPDADDVAINITWERTVAEIHKTLTTDTQVVKDVRNGNGGFCEMVKTSDGIAASKYPVVGKRTAFKVGTNSGYTLKSFNVTYTDESGKQVKLRYTGDDKGDLTRVGDYKATGTTYEFDVPNAKDISVNVTWAKK